MNAIEINLIFMKKSLNKNEWKGFNENLQHSWHKRQNQWYGYHGGTVVGSHYMSNYN